MTPIAPTRGNGHDRRVHEWHLRQVLENLRVFVVLNAVADGFQTNSGSRFGGSDRARRVEKYSIPRSAEAAATSGGVHIVPTADGVAGGPSVGAIVEDAGRTLRPIQESGLNA